ncbi:NfrA family protein [Methylocystis sp. JAN1]|uniref:NfrA family protein n=1 Tax=Methylocystis sp. JAN1 TaxID=3397211 RepID=UPI003FA242C4
MLPKFWSGCFAAAFASTALSLPPSDPARAAEAAGVKETPQPGTPGYQDLAFAFARLAKGDNESALKFARRARDLAPDYEMPIRVIADALSRANRPAEALDAINAYTTSHKPSPALLAQRGYLRKRLADAAGAEADLTQARASGALNKDQAAAADSALYDLAMDAAYKELSARHLTEAIKQAQIARRINPGAEAPVSVLIEGYAQEGRRQAALAEAGLYLSQNKASGRILAQRAYLRRAMNDLKGAEADFEAALASPDVEPDEAARLKEALAESKSAREVATSAEVEQAYKAIEAGDLARAIKLAREARAKDPTAEGPLLALMTALNRSGQPRAAVAEADAYIKERAPPAAQVAVDATAEDNARPKSNAPSVVLFAQRGYSRRAAGDLKGAVADFQAALARPGLEPTQEKQARLALAEAEQAEKPGGGRITGPTATPAEQALNRAYDALHAGRLGAAAQAAREARDLDPKAEEPTLILMSVYARQNRKAEALSEADRYLARAPHSAAILAQRGFLRRGTKNLEGAISDFGQALKSGLPAAQRATVAKALEEARYTLVAEKAFKASAAHDWAAALRYGRAAEAFPRANEAMRRVTIEALAGLGRRGEAMKASNALIARGDASGQAYAQRGYLREGDGDQAGAAADFQVALNKGGLPPSQRVSVRRGLAVAKAAVYEARGDAAEAQEELARFTQSHPDDADGWLALGGFYSRRRDYPQALYAYENSLAVERRGEALLNAGYASVYVDRSKESQFFREAIDRWSSDPSLSARPARDRDVIRNQIVEADASVRTNIVFGSYVDRPYRWGGHQLQPSFETVMRFDGRYLPYLFGLETFVGGFWSEDQTRFAEGYSRLGMRARPFDGINFSVSGEWQHYFVGNSPYNQFALSWGYGYGGFAYSSAPSAGAAGALQPADIAYPLETGWRPLTSFATYGTFRSGEHRYLQNAVGLLGYTYWNADNRLVVGPAGMAAAGYDSADLRQFAFGVGPAVVARLWVGGDYYRAYDGIITLQMGYLFPFGESHRQSGLNTTLGVSF